MVRIKYIYRICMLKVCSLKCPNEELSLTKASTTATGQRMNGETVTYSRSSENYFLRELKRRNRVGEERDHRLALIKLRSDCFLTKFSHNNKKRGEREFTEHLGEEPIQRRRRRRCHHLGTILDPRRKPLAFFFFLLYSLHAIEG